MLGEKPAGGWTSVETLEGQLAVLLSKLSDPLIQTVGSLINRINEHVETNTKKGNYLGGHTIMQVIEESTELITRAAAIFELVMNTVADHIIQALDYRIERDLRILENQISKPPGLKESNSD